MLMQLATIAGALLAGLAAIAIVYVLGMRVNSPIVHGPLIRFQRAILNPRQLQSAGSPGAYASVIRHRGRTSGRAYETPVGVVPGRRQGYQQAGAFRATRPEFTQPWPSTCMRNSTKKV